MHGQTGAEKKNPYHTQLGPPPAEAPLASHHQVSPIRAYFGGGRQTFFAGPIIDHLSDTPLESKRGATSRINSGSATMDDYEWEIISTSISMSISLLDVCRCSLDRDLFRCALSFTIAPEDLELLAEPLAIVLPVTTIMAS